MPSIEKWDCPQCEIELKVHPLSFGLPAPGKSLRRDGATLWIKKEPMLCRNCHKTAYTYLKTKGRQDQLDAWNAEQRPSRKIQLGFHGCQSCGSKDASLIHYKHGANLAPLCPDCEVLMERIVLSAWRD